MGREEQALQRYMRALELRRKTGDRRNAAFEQHAIGEILDDRGRFGAAVEAKKDGVSVLRDLGVRDAGFSDILAAYGRSLALSGRMAEAAGPLAEALTISGNLKDNPTSTQALRYQAESLYYLGNLAAAQQQVARAEQVAQQTSNAGLILRAQVVATLIDGAVRPTPQVAARFSALAKESESQGLQSLAAECVVHRAEALLRLGDHAAALQDAELAIRVTSSRGLRVAQAKAHFVRASALRANKNPDARQEYVAALKLLEQLRNETGNDKVLERWDLATIHAESVKGSAT
jgi:tetratricopeptide (TPR) repeat protein